MKEKPIIFSTEMVRAILEGRKTQTRRIFSCNWRHDIEDGKAYIEMPDGTWPELISPFGKPGDLLWVRETFCIDSRGAHGDDPGYYYKADIPTYEDGPEIWPDSWKPCIYMPKAAARIWLQITDVKVERLQDISEEDAKKEGVRPNFSMTVDFYTFAFMNLWESIYGDGSWVKNPWLWVISFKVLSTTGKPGTI